MHSIKQNYRPSKIEQLVLKQHVKKLSEDEVIVIHHVLEHTYLKVFFQIERRLNGKITFERILIEED